MLFCLNALLANVWLSQVTSLRVDVTEGNLYSISEPTHAYLGQLQEPLLLRGYFSAKTHPLLAPLVPQLRDMHRSRDYTEHRLTSAALAGTSGTLFVGSDGGGLHLVNTETFRIETETWLARSSAASRPASLRKSGFEDSI